MKIGFIGAGKVGCSLGRYLQSNGCELSGYYSRTPSSAQAAASAQNCRWFSTLEDVAENSELLFITTDDRAIGAVWSQLKALPIEEKWICHCSGSLSSGIFSEIQDRKAYGYSVHPLLAISSKNTDCSLLQKAVFTIEGDEQHLEDLCALFRQMGNEVKTISRAQKSLYHCAAVTVSNHVLSLLDCGIEMLCRCGFDRGAALSVLSPLILGNVKSALERDIPSSLTGPVERCDTVTIASHLHSLSFSQEQQTLYRLLALHLVDIASENHPQRDYSELRTMLGGLF